MEICKKCPSHLMCENISKCLNRELDKNKLKTLRDEFAMAALSMEGAHIREVRVAKWAYEIADAMLAEREK